MRARLAVHFLSCAYLIVGCHADRIQTYPTSGKVVFTDGKPVQTGTVELESITFKTSATGRILEDGTFVLGTYSSSDGAVAGKHRAIVVQLIVADGVIKHEKDHGRYVPPKYGRYETSGLIVEILAKPQNQILLTLESEGRK